MNKVLCILLTVLFGGFTFLGASAGDASPPQRPVALALTDDCRTLYVANQRSGTVCVVDAQTRRVAGETPIGKQLSDVAVAPDQSLIFTLDEAVSKLIVLRREPTLKEVFRLSVSRSPVKLAFSPNGRFCYVASLWSRRISVLDVSTPEQPRLLRALDLPLAPRLLLPLPDGKHVVAADSFGGRFVVIAVSEDSSLHAPLPDLKIKSVLSFAGHNIRGMSFSRDGEAVLLAHQILHHDNATTRGGVHWGGVMSNVVRRLSLKTILSSRSQRLDSHDVYYLGDPDHAAGDPGALLVTPKGRQIMTFSGINALAISDRGANVFLPTPVGRRPEAIAWDQRRNCVYVANRFSDSVSVVDVNSRKTLTEISLAKRSNRPAIDDAARADAALADEGEALFYDARLASDGWYSCHSCHTDGHTNEGRNDNFSDGAYGAPKRVLSLLGVGRTGPWAWNGDAKTLEDQIRTSISVTMRGPPPSPKQIDALTAYLRRLDPPPSIAAAREQPPLPAADRGERLFHSLGCASCHDPKRRYTSPEAYDVDLHDEAGNTTFNPPSLLGASQRDHFFHDGRAHSLSEVFSRFTHNLDRKLSHEELRDLLTFLKTK